MQFLILARDGTDAEAPARRLAARPDHLAGMATLRDSAHFVFGGATLDEHGAMTGSAIVFEFPDRAALDDWLRRDPYVTGNVWQHIDIQPFRLAKVE